MSVLFVYSQEPRLMALELAAHDAGVVVERARNALAAQRRLETMRPTLVVCAEVLDDMRGTDFLAGLRARPEFASTTLVLLTRSGRADRPVGPRDLTLDALLTVDDLWSHLGPLITPPPPAPVETPEPPTAARARDTDPGRRAVQMTGALAAFGLFELIGSLQQTRKTGQLRLHLDEFDAELFFLRGEIRHVEHLGDYGEDALREAVEGTRALPDATFTFEALAESAVEALPRTIARSTERVLLELAVQLDHGQAEGTHS